MVACCKPFGAALAVGVFGLLSLAFGVTLILLLPGIMKDQVIKNVQLDPNRMVFELWRDVPVPFFLSVYLFEVRNPGEIVKGGRPEVAQRGPYVYREHRQKTNITIHNNDTISYLEYRKFHFEPDLSNGTEADYVVVPNILVLGSAVILEDLPLAIRLTISSTFALFGEKAFMNRTVGEILWGYDDPLVDFLNTIKPGMLPYKGKFGLLADLNNSNTGLFTIFSGMRNVSRVHMVDSWNGLKKVSYWNSNQCNMINGTAGQIWPPFMTPSSPLEFYSPDACRSIKLDYSQSGNFRGIPTFRYLAPKTLFSNGTDYPPNEGFCPCRQSGIQNVSTCRFNAPLFISQPHFLNGDPSLVEAVGGLHPNEEEHGLFLDLHPLTGIPMNCSIKLQLSLYIKQVAGILQTGTTKPVVLPVLWFAESGNLEGPMLTMFYTNLVVIPMVLEYGQYFLVGLGILLCIISVVLVLRNKREADMKRRKKSNLLNGPGQDSETAPLLGRDPVHPGIVSNT